MKFDLKIISKIIKLFDKISIVYNPSLPELFISILRIIYCGSWVMDDLDIYRFLLKFIKSRLNWVIQSPKDSQINLIPIVFLKILRMISENTCLLNTNDKRINYQEILLDEVFIISYLWEAKKEEVLLGGKELFRQIISMSKNKIPELQKIFEEISKMQATNNQPLYINLLYTPLNFNFCIYTLIMIPPYMEKMLRFILLNVNRNNYQWYINFLFKTFKLTASETNKSLIVDMTRYLITNYFNIKDYTTPRYIILGFILNNIKNDLISGEVKQAIFFDWLFFNKEKDHLLLIEPGAMLIFFSAKNCTEITMELIDFLALYSKNFDNCLEKEIKNNVTWAFRECERHQLIPNLEYLLKEEKIKNDIKQIFLKLIDYREPQKQVAGERENIEKQASIQGIIPNQSLISIINEEASKFDDSDSDNELKQESTVLNTNKIEENKQLSIKLVAEIEFYIHQNLSDLIQNNYLNNFINYRSKKTFQELLDNFSNNFLQKLKSKNLLDSKLALIDQEVTDVYLHFANFFIKVFKDELELESVNKFFNNTELSFSANNDYLLKHKRDPIFNNISRKREPKEACNYILDYFIIKINNKNDKEASILTEIINRIIDLYPKFIIRVFGFLIRRINILKIKRANDLKINNFHLLYNNSINPDRHFIEIFSKLFKDNNEYFKVRIKLFIEVCVNEGELEILNIFFQNGLQFFGSIIENDQELVTKLLTYSSIETLNKISIIFQSFPNILNYSGFNFLSNADKISKLVEISVDMNVYEQEKIWILINSVKNLNKIINLKDFLIAITNYLKYLKTKKENDLENFNYENSKNLIFKNLIGTLRLNYVSELHHINDNMIGIFEFLVLFEIPYIFAQQIYELFRMMSNYINKFPEAFNLLFDEGLKKYENDINRNYYQENLLKILQEFIFIEKFNFFSILFDTNTYSFKNALSKIENIAKVKYSFC